MKKILIYFSFIVGFILVLLALWLVIKRFSSKVEVTDVSPYIRKIDSIRMENDRLIVSYEAAISKNIEVIGKLETSDKELNVIKQVVKTLTKERNDLKSIVSYQQQLIVSYTDSIKNHIVGYSGGDTNSPIVEKEWFLRADSMPFEYYVKQHITLGIDTFDTHLEINDYPIVVIADQKRGFFKAPIKKGYVTFSNPYNKVKTMEVIVEEDESTFKTKILPTILIVSSFIAGLLL